MAALTRELSEPGMAGLEEELTCSICLCLFSSPVTIPCGHNFCASCLELTWAGLAGNFSCPQCRATFAGRPQLQKNTVLCRVVEQLQGCAGAKAEAEAEEQVVRYEEDTSPILCDSCQQAPAVQTCLTCTASFCPEHLRPHRDSPAFRDHQLCPPLRDLQQRKCPQHNKLFEFFCSQHGSCICSLCLLGHKLCHTSPLQMAKANFEVSGQCRRGWPVLSGAGAPSEGHLGAFLGSLGLGGSLGAGGMGCKSHTWPWQTVTCSPKHAPACVQSHFLGFPPFSKTLLGRCCHGVDCWLLIWAGLTCAVSPTALSRLCTHCSAGCTVNNITLRMLLRSKEL